MTDENSMPPSITSTTGFGDCNTSNVSSSTEQFIICCKVCGSLNGLRRCSRCKSVYYCSQVHQQVDWRVHKIECKKFATNLATSELFNCVNCELHQHRCLIEMTFPGETWPHSIVNKFIENWHDFCGILSDNCCSFFPQKIMSFTRNCVFDEMYFLLISFARATNKRLIGINNDSRNTTKSRSVTR